MYSGDFRSIKSGVELCGLILVEISICYFPGVECQFAGTKLLLHYQTTKFNPVELTIDNTGLKLSEFSEAALKKQIKVNDKELTAVSIF